MPDATGTPTTPDGIPTYNTSGDPPSGKGFNTAMAAIQAALTARIKQALLSATGDLVYASGAGVAARLGIGSTGQLLKVVGGVPAWATTPAIHVRMPDQSIPSGAFTTLAGWNTADVQQGGFTYNTNGPVLPETGLYLATLYAYYVTSSTGAKDAQVTASAGSAINVYSGQVPTGDFHYNFAGLINGSAGAQISVIVSHASGAPNLLRAGAASVSEGLSLVRVG